MEINRKILLFSFIFSLMITLELFYQLMINWLTENFPYSFIIPVMFIIFILVFTFIFYLIVKWNIYATHHLKKNINKKTFPLRFLVSFIIVFAIFLFFNHDADLDLILYFVLVLGTFISAIILSFIFAEKLE